MLELHHGRRTEAPDDDAAMDAYYGDESPVTTAGPRPGYPVMLVGVAFVAILTGAVAQRFLAPALRAVHAPIGREVAVDLGNVRDATPMTAHFKGTLTRAHEFSPEVVG